jgi:hypothetical protein
MIAEMKNRLNIKDMTLIEPRLNKDFPNNLDSYLTDEDWQVMLKDMTNTKYLQDVMIGTWEVANAIIAFPKSREKLPLQKTSETLQIMEDGIPKYRGLVNPETAKILFPNDYTSYITYDFSHYHSAIAEKLNEGEGADEVIRGIYISTILYPEKSHEFEHMIGLREFMESSLHKNRRDDNYYEFANTAVAIRLLYGKEQLDINEEDWHELRSKFFDSKNKMLNEGDVGLFCQFSANIAFISAEKVEITDHSVNLIMPKPEEDFTSTTFIPERRKF